MTKIWCRSLDEGECTDAIIVEGKVQDDDFDPYMSVMSGIPMTGRFPATKIKISSSAPPSDYIETGGMFIVSDRLRSVLEGFKCHAEYFQLDVSHKRRKYDEKLFYFANILDCIDGFDYKNGGYTFLREEPPYVNAIKKLALDQEKIASSPLFRLANGGSYIVCACEEMANTIVEQQFTGVRFLAPEDWRFGC